MAESTASILREQWRNPTDVSTILLIIGGDVVRMAFSQGAGTFPVPVCFSFGCVAYTFIGLISVIGDGRLLSPPDYTCKLINLKSGYARNSNNFVLSRILRDMEAAESRRRPPLSKEVEDENDDDYAIRISVYEAMNNTNAAAQLPFGIPHMIALLVSLAQVCVSLIPWYLNRSWNVLFITLSGIFLVQWTGFLPQWVAEKLPNRQRSYQVFALTSGNGSRDVIVIVGAGKCLDLEALASTQTPRNGRPWEKLPWLSHSSRPSENGQFTRRARLFPTRPYQGVPLGFVITQFSFACLSVLWILLLINVSASTELPEGWCFIAVGALGMFQNAWLAAREMDPKMRNLPLARIGQFRAKKVMDGIMDFHRAYEMGEPLLREFFPGKLRPDEEKWWSGRREAYDAARALDQRPQYRSISKSALILGPPAKKRLVPEAGEVSSMPISSDVGLRQVRDPVSKSPPWAS